MSSVPPARNVAPVGVPLPVAVCLGELHRALGGLLDAGVDSRVVLSVASVEEADDRCLAPVLAARAAGPARRSPAVVLVDESLGAMVPIGSRWLHKHARWVLASILDRAETSAPAMVSPHAVVEPGVELGAHPSIGAGAAVLAGAIIGDDCRIGPNAVVFGRVRLGDRVSVGAGAVVGRPGFGWATGPEGQVRRMPQLGGVLVEDDVEIGALSTVDAGTLGPTVLRRGSKLDAQVHVGHNVEIGAGTMIAAQCGFAGSARIGSGVLVGGQAGVADHVVVGDGARLAGKSGVIGNVAPGMVVAGYPAVERMRWLRAVATSLRGRST